MHRVHTSYKLKKQKVTRKQIIIAFTHARPRSDIGDNFRIYANKDFLYIRLMTCFHTFKAY